MSHQTLVYKLAPAQAERLAELLTAAGYQFQSLAHARYQARGEGVIASMYRSGKLVVQGRQAQAFALQYLPEHEPNPSKEKGASGDTAENADRPDLDGQPHLGSDEAGKGDSFGGLTVAAVALAAENMTELREAGVADSKRVSDKRIPVLAAWLRQDFICAERVLEPAAYNQAQAQAGNVNRLLTQLHRDLIGELHERTGIPLAVVDRFGSNLPVTRALKGSAPGLKVVEVPRAESYLAVAAASILARDAFLSMIGRLSDQWAIDLPLGSGAPVPPALRRFLQIHGAEALGEVAKTHFRNVQRALS